MRTPAAEEIDQGAQRRGSGKAALLKVERYWSAQAQAPTHPLPKDTSL